MTSEIHGPEDLKIEHIIAVNVGDQSIYHADTDTLWFYKEPQTPTFIDCPYPFIVMALFDRDSVPYHFDGSVQHNYSTAVGFAFSNVLQVLSHVSGQLIRRHYKEEGIKTRILVHLYQTILKNWYHKRKSESPKRVYADKAQQEEEEFMRENLDTYYTASNEILSSILTMLDNGEIPDTLLSLDEMRGDNVVQH